MSLRIALAGGGNKEDSKLVDEYFANWIGKRGKMLYIPIALRRSRHSFSECYEWICSVFSPFGITHIEMWTDLGQHSPNELEAFDSVYIGGGNTFSLFAELLESGFAQALRRYAFRGGAIYGGSAGAVILGKDLLTVQHLDSNDIGLTERAGLDLLRGYAIWVHYMSKDDDLIHEYVNRNKYPVLAIPERSGIVVEDNRLFPIGFEAVYRFDEGRKEQVF